MENWNNQKVDTLVSKGGVIALANPFDNLVSSGVLPWPPSEIVQKLYQSRQSRAFSECEREKLDKFNGYYSDLQSINSEDAITWSVFGTVAHAPNNTRNPFVYDLLESIGCKTERIQYSEMYLWRRIPHPDTLVPGGPEIDFGITTDKILILGEAKWKSAIGVSQGKKKDKDQIQLRMEFLQNYAPKLYPNIEQFIVLGVGLHNNVCENISIDSVRYISTTWEKVCQLESHPNHQELLRYLNWKKSNAKKQIPMPISGSK